MLDYPQKETAEAVMTVTHDFTEAVDASFVDHLMADPEDAYHNCFATELLQGEHFGHLPRNSAVVSCLKLCCDDVL